MTYLAETQNWEPGVYQLEEDDLVHGGDDGIDNVQAKQLANRTLWLKALCEDLALGKQDQDPTLTAIADLVTAADKLIYATGSDAFATSTLTAFMRTLLDDVDAAAARATLGAAPIASPALTGTPTAPTAAGGTNTTQLATTAFVKAAGDTKQPLDATLTAIAALVTAADQLIYSTGVDTFAQTALTTFMRTLLDDVDAAAARTTLGAAPLASPALTGTPTAPTAAPGTNTTQLATTAFVQTAAASADKQPLDATLTALAAMVTAADQLIYSTGVDTFAQTALTAFMRTLLDDVDAAAARTTLGAAPLASPALTGTPTAPTAAPGTNTTQLATTAFVKAAGDTKQPLDVTLTAIAALVTTADQLIYSTGVDTFAQTALTAFARTLLDDPNAAAARDTLGVTAGAAYGTNWFKLPDWAGGFIIQVGSSLSTASSIAFAFPIAFTTTVLAITHGQPAPPTDTGGVSAASSIREDSISLNGFVMSTNGWAGHHYIAIGK